MRGFNLERGTAYHGGRRGDKSGSTENNAVDHELRIDIEMFGKKAYGKLDRIIVSVWKS